jgi:hypothetical protein
MNGRSQITKNKDKILLISFILLFLSCTSTRITKNEYDVYNVLLEDEIKQSLPSLENSDKIQMLIDDSTGVFYGGEIIRIDSKCNQFIARYINNNIDDDFYFKNVKHYYIPNNFTISIPNVSITVEMLTKNEKNQLFGREAIYKEFPKSIGIIQLSRVGFSRDNKHAKVYIGRTWNRIAGDGYEIILEKENDKWFVKSKTRIWNS